MNHLWAQWGYFENSKLKRDINNDLAKLYYVYAFFFNSQNSNATSKCLCPQCVRDFHLWNSRGVSGGVSKRFRLWYYCWASQYDREKTSHHSLRNLNHLQHNVAILKAQNSSATSKLYLSFPTTSTSKVGQNKMVSLQNVFWPQFVKYFQPAAQWDKRFLKNSSLNVI